MKRTSSNFSHLDIDSAELPVEEMEQKLLVTRESTEEAERPILTPEEVMAILLARNSEDAEAERAVEEARIVKGCPTERTQVTTDEQPEDREVVIVPDEEKETRQAPPKEETARARAAPVHTYQRRSAREETSGRKSAEEQPREASTQRAETVVDSPAKSGVTPPRRKRKLVLVSEPEEEEDVICTPLDELPSSRPTAPHAEVEDSDARRKERKRKGKAIATPEKKKLRQTSSTIVIQEGRQRIEEANDEE